MKIVKGAEWLKHEFVEQLEQLLETNHVVEIDTLVNFDGKEQFVKNMLVRGELARATNSDVIQQVKVERAKKAKTLRSEKLKDKLLEEEIKLKEIMGL